MLYKETVERETFELLKTLMQDEQLKDFYLVGGTALALRMGHRTSVDIDLFSDKDFNAKELENHLDITYQFKTAYLRGCTIKGNVQDVKLDCILHNYPLIENVIEIEGIRMLNLQDIAAMKLSAIADNGTRMKDFIDIAYLSTKLSLETMLEAYERKYKNTSSIRALKALTFFDDINFNEPIRLVNKNFDWDNIKRRILDMIDNSSKTFLTV